MASRTLVSWAGIVPLLLGLSACSKQVPAGETAGELGNGTFSYVCVDTSDPSCVDGAKTTEFPDRIGLGGSFDVLYTPEKGGVDHYDIHTASPEVLEELGGAFLAKSPGVVALLAQRTSDGHIFDFVHVNVVAPHEVRLDADGVSPSLVWHTGTRQTLRATVVDADLTTLAGSREFDWTTSSEARVRLERQSPSASMDLFPLAPGAATITVTSGAATVDLALTIEGAAVRDPDEDAGRGPEQDASVPVKTGADGGASTTDGAAPSANPQDASLPDGSDR